MCLEHSIADFILEVNKGNLNENSLIQIIDEKSNIKGEYKVLSSGYLIEKNLIGINELDEKLIQRGYFKLENGIATLITQVMDGRDKWYKI